MPGQDGQLAWEDGLWTSPRGLECHQITSVDLCCSNSVDGMRDEGLGARDCVPRLISAAGVCVNSEAPALPGLAPSREEAGRGGAE